MGPQRYENMYNFMTEMSIKEVKLQVILIGIDIKELVPKALYPV